MTEPRSAAAPRRNIPLLVAAIVAAAWVISEIQWLHALNWDEIEFFRATKWVSDGKLPYRDFWEHHAPLQWFLFAPIAWFLDAPGIASVITLRWAQLALWLCGGWLLLRLSREVTERRWAALGAIVLLISSHAFTGWAIEYRVDTPASILFLAAVLVSVTKRSRTAWTTAGAMFALSVLANLRLAPVVVITSLLLLATLLDERRWGWNARALWLIAGAIPVTIAYLTYALASGSFDAMIDGLITYNSVSDRLVRGGSTPLPLVGRLFTNGDIGAIALFGLAAAGAASTLRSWRRPDAAFLFTCIAAVTVVAFASLGVHYGYHLQLTFLFAAVLAAPAISSVAAHPSFEEGARIPLLLAAASVASVIAGVFVDLARSSPALLTYQNTIMIAADRVTEEGDAVWDGCGFALRRRPAYGYWFLPAGVRVMAQEGLIDRYTDRELAANPPAAVIMNFRTYHWLRTFPTLGAAIARSYVPLYRNLWVPGMSARLEGEGSRASWRALRGGEYRLHASDLLASHPWFRAPLESSLLTDSQLLIPLDRLPQVDPALLRCSVKGVAVDCRSNLHLRRGDQVTVDWSGRSPVGLILVDARYRQLFVTPDEGFTF